MKRRNYLLPTLLACLSTLSIYGQRIALSSSYDLNFISQKSDYEICDFNNNPISSFSIGAFYEKNDNKKAHLRTALDYSRLSNYYYNTDLANLYYSNFNETEFELRTINHYLTLSELGILNIGEHFSFGLGLSCNILLCSKLKAIKSEKDYPYHFWNNDKVINKDKYDNTFYRTVTLSVPINVNYRFKQMEVFINYRHGIINKLKEKSLIKEYDRTLMVGIAYIFDCNKMFSQKR